MSLKLQAKTTAMAVQRVSTVHVTTVSARTGSERMEDMEDVEEDIRRNKKIRIG